MREREIQEANATVKQREEELVGPTKKAKSENLIYEEEKALVRTERKKADESLRERHAAAKRSLELSEASHKQSRIDNLHDTETTFTNAKSECNSSFSSRSQLIHNDEKALDKIEPLLAKLLACKGGSMAGTSKKTVAPNSKAFVEIAAGIKSKSAASSGMTAACIAKAKSELADKFPGKLYSIGSRGSILLQISDASNIEDVTGQLEDWKRRVLTEKEHAVSVRKSCMQSAEELYVSEVDTIEASFEKSMSHSSHVYKEEKAFADRHHADEMANLDAHLAEKKAAGRRGRRFINRGKESE